MTTAAPVGAVIGPDCQTPPHAVRILARALLNVIRHWQDNVAYDPAKHSALQHVLTEQTKINDPQLDTGPGSSVGYSWAACASNGPRPQVHRSGSQPSSWRA